MEQPRDVAVLTKALSQRLISFEQYSLMLRELSEDPQISVHSLLLSRGKLSEDQLGSLIEETAGMKMAATQEATEEEDISEYPTEDPADTIEAPATARRSATLRSAGATTPSQVALGGLATPDADWAKLMQVDSELRYQLKAEIARGGLGRILQARDQHLGRDVAIKEMLPQRTPSAKRLHRFLLEAQVTGQLEHPSIVPIYALGVNPSGQPFYSMKLIGGRTLAEVIKEYHALEPKSARASEMLHDLLSAMVDMCNAIGFAHDRGVLHRDIKPQNVMIGDFGETLVVDWGLAKLYRESETKQRHDEASKDLRKTTQLWQQPANENGNDEADFDDSETNDDRRHETAAGTVIGTIPYMSPEQAAGAVETLDARCDIFSLGATLYEVLTGQFAYQGQKSQLLEQARLCKFAPPRKIKPEIPAALEAVCLKAMAAEPDDRYQTAKELGEEISRWQSGRPVDAYPEPWLDRAERFVREHRTACLSTAAALLALLLVGGAWRWHSWQRIESVAAGARVLVSQGQQAFNQGRFEAAAENFTEAKGQAAAEPSLVDLQSEIQTRIDEARQRLEKTRAAALAKTKLRNFDRLHDDALFYGMLLVGYDVRKSIERAEQSATDALALFAVRADSDRRPQLTDLLYSEEEQQRVIGACRRLRMVLADAAAQPLDTASEEARHAAALRALAILDRVDVDVAGGVNREVDGDDRPLKALHLRRALYLKQAGDTAAAWIERQRADDVQPADAHDHFMVGDFHYRNQDYTLAIHQFQQALRKAPDHFWAQYYLGVCQLRLEHWSEAIASFNASIRPGNEFVYVYILRGLAYGEMGDLDAAEADFAQAARIDPNEYGLYINRGIVRLRHRQVKKAADDFRIAIDQDDQQPAGYLNLAEALRLQGKMADALVELEHCIEVAPTYARAFHAKAIIHVQQNKLDESLDDLDDAIRWAPSGSMLAAQIHADRGKVLHRQKHYEQALDEYELAIADRPDYHLALVLKGIDLMDMAKQHAAQRKTEEARKDRRAAIECFDRFLKQSPIVNQAYRTTGASNVNTETDAGQVLPETISPTRLLAIVYRERGMARNLVGDVSPAMEDFGRAMELLSIAKSPPTPFERARYRNLRMRRGWAYLLRARQLALADFEAAIKEAPNDAEPYTGRGYVLVKLGDYRKAIRDADKAVSLKSKNPGVDFNAAGIYAQAIPLVLDDKTADDRGQLAKAYRARAIRLLRSCLVMSPQKRRFYLQQIGQDDALDPIRSDPALGRLIDEFTKQASFEK